MEYGLGLMHFRPTRAIAGEGTSCYVVTVNGRQSGKLYDADGRPLYIDDNRAGPSTDPNISDFRVPQKATQVYGALWNVSHDDDAGGAGRGRRCHVRSDRRERECGAAGDRAGAARGEFPRRTGAGRQAGAGTTGSADRGEDGAGG